MKRFIAIFFGLMFGALTFTACTPEEPDIKNRKDWTVIFEDERADPVYLEIAFDEIVGKTFTFKYTYKQGEEFLPKVTLKYKDGNSDYYNIRTSTIKKLDIWDEWQMDNSVTGNGKYMVDFVAYKDDVNDTHFIKMIHIEINMQK